jgi:hypothetical protein
MDDCSEERELVDLMIFLPDLAAFCVTPPMEMDIIVQRT